MSDEAFESLAAARRADARCDKFELALATGQSPQIESFLTDMPASERQGLLLELLGLELDFRVAHDEQPKVGDYAKRFPELSAEQLAAIVEASRGRAGVIPPVGSAVPNADQLTILSPADAVELASDASAAALRRVRYFGDYELLREIARGGMGVVYEARQRSLNRPVALKMILSGRLASAEEVTRFRREAEAAAQLEHPGIVPIYEIGTDGDQHYFTMGYVAGPSLSARLLDRPLEPREAATLIRDVALAVQYAHERGVVHRDLKPSNILLALRSDSSHVRQNVGQSDVRPHSGECGYAPRITDFGLAKVSHADHSLTETGQILGTPSYMPPEQASGLTHEIGPAADIYSLGAVLYACLTGRPPFQAASVLDTVRQVLERDPVSLRDLNVAIPQDLETICLKCLEKSIPRRYPTAAEVADELQRFLEGRPIEARPVSRRERVWRWSRRNPVVAGLSAAVAMSLLLGIVVSSYFAWKENKRAISESDARRDEELQRKNADRQTVIAKKLGADNLKLAEDEKAARNKADLNAETAKQQSELAQQQAEIANRQTDLAQRQTKLTKRHLYVAHMNLAKAAWEASRVAEVTRLLDLYRPVAGQNVEDDNPRGFEWYYWDRCCHCDRLTLTAPKPLQSMAFSRDGKWLATASYNTFVVKAQPGEVKLWDAATGREVRTLKGHTRGVNDVEFSPDGKRLASSSGDATVKIWDVETGRELVTFNGHSAAVYQLTFSRDGRRLASASAMSPPQPIGTPDAIQLKLWDASSGKEIRTFDLNADRTRCLAFSPDDRTLASGGLDGINLLDTVTGKLRRSLEYDNSQAAMGRRWIVSDVAFSPDGKLLASVCMDQTIKLWDVTTGKNTSTIRGQTEGFTSVAFTPDGQRLVSSCFDQTINEWDIATGQERLCLKGHTDRIIRVAMNTDGTRIASADYSGGVKLWDTATLQTARPLEVADGVGGMAFRDDGELLAVTGLAQTIHLCDPNTGKVTRTLKIDARRSSVPGQYSSEIDDVAFSPDGTRLAVACGDWTAKVFNVATGAEVLTLQPHTGGVSSVAFSRDQKWLATASANTMSSNTPGEVKVWDAATGALKFDLKGHANRVHSVAFSPDSKWLASASSDKTFRIWEIATGQQSRSLAGHTGAVNCVAFSPEGNRIASAGGHHDHSIKLWDVGNCTELLSIKGHLSSVNRVVFSRDGQRLASASDDGTVKVWDAQTGLEILTFKGDMRFYKCVAFSPDSKRLAAGGIYGSARLGSARIWDGVAEDQRTQSP